MTCGKEPKWVNVKEFTSEVTLVWTRLGTGGWEGNRDMRTFLKEDTAGLGERWNVAVGRIFWTWVTRILSRKSWFCGKDDEFGLGCVELVLPLGGRLERMMRQLEMWSAAGRCFPLFALLEQTLSKGYWSVRSPCSLSGSDDQNLCKCSHGHRCEWMEWVRSAQEAKMAEWSF